VRKAKLRFRKILISLCPGVSAAIAGLAAVELARPLHVDALWSWLGLSFLYGAVVLATFVLMRNQLLPYWQELISERAANTAAVPEQGVA
jgi:hypothetical protein